MSHAVVRGHPTPAQLYLDSVLDAVLRARGAVPTPTARAELSMAQVMHHCLRTKPEHVFVTNGATGERFTSGQMLELSVPLARTMVARGLTGKTALVAARDHEHTLAVYLALQFAGVVPFMIDPASTKFELQHFLRLIEPSVVFCDAATLDGVVAVTGDLGDARPPVVPIHTDQLLEFAKGHDENIDSYRVPSADPYAPVLLLPTSGSTGLPKAAIFNNRGLIDHLPVTWMHHTQFPTPTRRVMLLTTPQWATFTMLVTCCPVYQVELLLSPKLPTVEHVLEMMEKYQPTWTFVGPPFAKNLVNAGKPHHFASLKQLMTLGSHITPELLAALKEKMSPSSSVIDGYGMTEVQGFVTITDPGAPPGCSGPVANLLHYKIVKEDGEEAATDEEGELYLKADCIIKGYFKNDTELPASMTDGWLKSGDEFAQDARRRLYYRRRIKFSFKHNNRHVSPEEVEGVVSSVHGVMESVVCESAGGPAAAVVLREPAADHAAFRETIHSVVNEVSLPRMHHTQFPTPTRRVMLLTTPQWATFTMLVTCCPVYQVELLLSPKLPTVEHVLEMMEKYQPTWTFVGPPFAKNLVNAGKPHHFASLKQLMTLGSHITPELLAALKEKMSPSSSVIDGYGMTEVQGFVTITDPGAPPGCSGPVANLLHYKIVKEDGEEAATDEEGELYLKADCIIKGYFKNDTELPASMTDGWLKSGDEFAQDARRRLYYRRRIKFSFKHNNRHVSPEEVEGVVSSVHGVMESVVCESAGGPAAAVVLREPAADHAAFRETIHSVVNASLSEHKRLTGGIAFVTSLPRTHTGKVHRPNSREMLHQLMRDGLCF